MVKTRRPFYRTGKTRFLNLAMMREKELDQLKQIESHLKLTYGCKLLAKKVFYFLGIPLTHYYEPFDAKVTLYAKDDLLLEFSREFSQADFQPLISWLKEAHPNLVATIVVLDEPAVDTWSWFDPWL